MSDKPHDKAVRSPWTEGAWIMAAEDVPDGWAVRRFTYRPFVVIRYPSSCIVEAKP